MFRQPVRLEEWIALDGGLAVDVAKEGADAGGPPADSGDPSDGGDADAGAGKDSDSHESDANAARRLDTDDNPDGNAIALDLLSTLAASQPDLFGGPLEFLLDDLPRWEGGPSGGFRYYLDFLYPAESLTQLVPGGDSMTFLQLLIDILIDNGEWDLRQNFYLDYDRGAYPGLSESDVSETISFFIKAGSDDFGGCFLALRIELSGTGEHSLGNLLEKAGGSFQFSIMLEYEGEPGYFHYSPFAPIAISNFVLGNKPSPPSPPEPDYGDTTADDPVFDPAIPDVPIPSWDYGLDRGDWALPARFDFADDWWEEESDPDSQARAMLPDLPELGDMDSEVHQAVGEAMRFITRLQDAMERFQTHIGGQDADELPDAEAAEAGALLMEGRRQLELLRNEVGLLVGQAESFADLPPEQRDGVVNEDLSTQIETTSRVAGQASAMADAFYAVDRLVAPQAEGLGIGLRELFQRVFGASERKAGEARERRDPLVRSLEEYRLKER